MDELTIAIKAITEKIFSQREEVLQAFIAKYGCEPDECEQVIISDCDTVIRWSIRKKITKNS